MNYFANAGQLLIAFVFGILVTLVVLRVLLQVVRANFYNPICQMLYKVTNPVLMPMRRVVPSWRNLDVAGIVLAWLLLLVERTLSFALAGSVPNIAGLAIIALADLIGFVLVLYIVLIIVRVVLGFVNADARQPAVPLVYQLTEPVLAPVKKRLPSFGGLDFSPMVVTLVIALARILVVAPIFDLGLRIGMGL
ncbi:YggT family protein [Dokdonella sp. MW10]|uniref:YggT family protein n=1 Tax=Dokdonella sp. MW10 TaxID=2992926 RepID=UPI003F7FBD31